MPIPTTHPHRPANVMADDDLRHENGESSDDCEGGSVFVNLTVPPDAEAGVDYLSFEYGGAELEVLVPAGSSPGDVLRINGMKMEWMGRMTWVVQTCQRREMKRWGRLIRCRSWVALKT